MKVDALQAARPKCSADWRAIDFAVHRGRPVRRRTRHRRTHRTERRRVWLMPCRPTKMLALWNNFRAAAEKNGWAVAHR